jgi:hypothetical protein
MKVEPHQNCDRTFHDAFFLDAIEEIYEGYFSFHPIHVPLCVACNAPGGYGTFSTVASDLDNLHL